MSERYISSQKTLVFRTVKFQDEGYYCLYLYRQGRLLSKGCAKLVVLGKHLEVCTLYVLCKLLQTQPSYEKYVASKKPG